MQGVEDKELNARIVKAWQSGRYKSYSSLARVFRTYPKMVERVVKKAIPAPLPESGGKA